jgi:DNA polymerase elongation subunit (family B)
MAKLEIITNNISMATVCHVPLHYIFFRGQGIKSLSLVAKYCREKGFLIPVLKKLESDEENTGYEGATVMDPIIGFHKKAVTVLDYSSLYPSSIIMNNLSHEMFVRDAEYDNLPNYTYNDVYYTDSNGEQVHCRFAKKDNEFGIIPSILLGLLTKRKETKKEMGKETDPFKKNILDGKQNALKITANSIYGQLGASTSPIYFKHGAACTTAIGRNMLYLAKEFVEDKLPDILSELYLTIKANNNDMIEAIFVKHLKERNKEFETFLISFLVDIFDKYTIKPKILYGDTDSIFINFDMKDKITNEDIYKIDTLMYNIELGKIASKLLKTLLPYPQNMEYEKTFYPFALMAKKKYIGNKYEDDIHSFKQTSMGVVLKRRDNANIVKKIIGGMVNIMMNEIDIDKAVRFIKKCVNDLIKGKYEIHDFITSKTLKADYVDRTRLAHVVLADRMAKRDPGNAPQLNDRIPFVAIEVKDKKGVKLLQGNRIEHPDYIIENNLKIDYLFYLTNQIINPATQFLELIMKPVDVDNIFKEYIIGEENRRKGIQSLNKYGIIKTNSSINNDDEFDFDKLIKYDAKPNNNIKSKKSNIVQIIDSEDNLSAND